MSDATNIRVNSRIDFRKTLGQTIAIARQLAAKTPEYPVYRNIVRQLEAMSTWTSDDRVPTETERSSIDVGLVAVRELDSNPDPQIQDLTNRIYELSSFFDELK